MARCGDRRQPVTNDRMMASQENTGEKSKRRKILVRQEAKTEVETVETVELSPPQCRIIYKETISLPLSPPHSVRYLAAQYSGNSFNRFVRLSGLRSQVSGLRSLVSGLWSRV